jgi:aspartate-semialdehyde dehydrogenase
MSKIYKVGILGGTGLIGQNLIKLLINENLFHIEEIGGSMNSVHKYYKDIWKLNDDLPEIIGNKVIKLCIPENFKNCDFIFSTLNENISGEIENLFFMANFPIISNSSCYRMHEDIPIIVPYINNNHLELIKKQRSKYNINKGFIIKNANCVTVGLIYSIYNLHRIFKIKQLNINTMQSISENGFSGTSAYDIINNIIPYIDDEEEKLKNEPLKILGELYDNNIIMANINIDSTCNRVNVLNGHTLCISLKFHENINNITLNEIKKTILENNNCIRIFENKYRPQPSMDLNYLNGYGISIGRIRKSNYWDLEMTVVCNNLIIGAAGSSILNAKICIENNLI